MDERFLRNEMLWGKESQQCLAHSHVILFGLGGVGSYTAECLARSGIGELTLVDSDTVSISIVTDPSGKAFKIGLINPAGNKIYVNGIGGIGATFEIKKDGDYVVFVENTDSTAFNVTGSAGYY